MIADTSFIVALSLAEDHSHTKAISLLEQFDVHHEQILILDRVLEETFTVLTYKRGVTYALDIIEKFSKNKNIHIHKLDDNEWSSVLQLAVKLQKKLSFVDYSILYLYLKFREPLLCFDEEIIKLTKTLS